MEWYTTLKISTLGYNINRKILPKRGVEIISVVLKLILARSISEVRYTTGLWQRKPKITVLAIFYICRKNLSKHEKTLGQRPSASISFECLENPENTKSLALQICMHPQFRTESATRDLFRAAACRSQSWEASSLVLLLTTNRWSEKPCMQY